MMERCMLRKKREKLQQKVAKQIANKELITPVELLDTSHDETVEDSPMISVNKAEPPIISGQMQVKNDASESFSFSSESSQWSNTQDLKKAPPSEKAMTK